jgi:hypothetical protein
MAIYQVSTSETRMLVELDDLLRKLNDRTTYSIESIGNVGEPTNVTIRATIGTMQVNEWTDYSLYTCLVKAIAECQETLTCMQDEREAMQEGKN